MSDTNPTPTQPETLELLPCPFCGGKAESSPTGSGDGGICVDRWAINCRACNFEMIEMAIEGDNPFYLTALRTLTTKWNRRAAVAEPRRDGVDAERVAATIVALWRAENSDDGTLVKYIKQSLLGARIGAAATSSPAPAESDDAHRCPHCSRLMRSDFDEDIGMWYECDNCDYREQVSSAAPPERTQVAGEQVPASALIQLLNAALLRPESAEENIRRVIEELSRAAAPADDDALTQAALAFANGQELSQAELESLKTRLAAALRAAQG